MTHHHSIMDWIAGRQGEMLAELIEWSNINTGTGNVAGVEKLLSRVRDFAKELGGGVGMLGLPPATRVDRSGNVVEFPVGPALCIAKRTEAQRRILLCIHSDTVYPADSAFHKAQIGPDGNLNGPGVADAKGGLMVMLTALAAFERSPLAKEIGWEVIINPDEEIGSPSSAIALQAVAKRNQIGLLFEPALGDGGLADRRKGSGNFSIVVRGRSAHTGRDFASGRNAVLAAARLAIGLDEINRTHPGLILNVGAIDGGGPANVVPDLAICRVNVRTENPEDEVHVKNAINICIEELNGEEGITAKVIGGFLSPPKIPDAAGRGLLDAVVQCGKELKLNLATHSVGGSCDGNRLAAWGLPNVDTLGVRGGKMHSPGEFMIPESLTERAQLTALLLLKLAAGEIALGTGTL
jgi:glutamate carboxypeptidase